MVFQPNTEQLYSNKPVLLAVCNYSITVLLFKITIHIVSCHRFIFNHPSSPIFYRTIRPFHLFSVWQHLFFRWSAHLAEFSHFFCCCLDMISMYQTKRIHGTVSAYIHIIQSISLSSYSNHIYYIQYIVGRIPFLLRNPQFRYEIQL